MKKIYSTPHTEIVKIQTNRMIAVSLPKETKTVVDDNDEVLSRRHHRDIWDDEEDDE